jgi:nitrite reductase/ring-hydroxylating ferredoxin subunit
VATLPELRDWTPVTPAVELPDGKPILVRVGEIELFLFRSGERLYAASNRCTHIGGPLHRGAVNPSASLPTVTCPIHGSIFLLSDGRVLRGPAGGPLPVYDARVNEGMIEVRARS